MKSSDKMTFEEDIFKSILRVHEINVPYVGTCISFS